MVASVVQSLPWLVLLLSIGIVPQQATIAQRGPWSFDQLTTRCPEFRRENGALIETRRCLVTGSGEFAVLESDTYYYVYYCIEDEFSAATVGSCLDAGSVLGRTPRSSIAVFARPKASKAIRLIASFDSYGAGNFGDFRAPSIAVNAFGAVMELPLVTAATCYCNSSIYFISRSRGRRWELLDFDEWERELSGRLPAGLISWNKPWPDLQRMTVDGTLWRANDSHADPTGGRYQARLEIEKNKAVLKSVTILPPEQPRH